MAHPYFVKEDVFEDIPRLRTERDNDWIDNLGERSDDVIDNMLPSPTITVPLSTVPDIIRIASTLMVEGMVYQKWGELKRGQLLIDQATEKVQEYITTFKQNSADRTAVVNIDDGTYHTFDQSPLTYDYYN